MDHRIESICGEVADVFAHRFVIATTNGRILADLGPEGADLVKLKVGEKVEVTGESRPSEMKVSKISRPGGEPVEIGHEPKAHQHGKHEGDVDASVASRAVEAKGFTVVGEPRRKPKHFDVTGRDADGNAVELHVGFDGTVRNVRPKTSKPADLDRRHA